MNVRQIVATLEKEGIRLWEEDGALRFRAPQGTLTEERRALLRTNRDAVLAHLIDRREATQLVPDLAAGNEPFPLTDIQAAYLVGRGSAYGYGGVACHVYVELSYPADTDPDRVNSAWWEVVRRHDMLRAVVHPDGFQEVLSEMAEPPVPTADLRGSTAAEVDRGIARIRSELAARVPRTDRPPLFVLRMTRSDDELVLHLSIDQLIVDYASLMIVLAEMEDVYHGRPLAPLTIGFRDYVLARRKQTLTGDYDRHRDYWLRRLAELPGPPDLPVATDPDGARSFRRYEVVLGEHQRKAFEANATANGTTASAAALTAYAEVVGRWSRNPEFMLNVPTFTRLPLHTEVDQLVGDFTDVELLAVDLRPRQTFAERSRTLGANLLEDLSHSLFTGSRVLAELNRARGADTVLMPVVFTSTLGSATTRQPTGRIRHARTQTPQVWLDCQVMDRAGELALSWDVREGVLAENTAAHLFDAFVELISTLAADDTAWRTPAAIELPAQTRAVREQPPVAVVPPPRALLQDAVLATAARLPDEIAVVDRGRRMTYRELIRQATGVARTLAAAGVEPGDLVVITMEKGWEQVAGVLGTLLAGAAYLPVDTTQPQRRREAILNDAKAKAVLTQSWLMGDCAWPEHVTSLPVDGIPATDGPPPEIHVDVDALAYVIYTSGSTGAPKGVMISHAAAVNTVADINRRFDVQEGDRVFALAQLGFDLSVYDVFGPLSVGATIVLPDPARRGDPSSWVEILRTDGVTIWNSVPGQLQMVTDYLRTDDPPLPSLRLAMLSGDWIPLTLPEAIWRWAPDLKIHSLGGATEASIWSIHHPVDRVDPAWRSVPYGKPLSNQGFHVLDHAMRPCPDFVVGELYISGVGLAKGYLGDAQRTESRFIPHPDTGERLYRTGDLGRFHPDGVIEFLGREDQQVKIRGYRIELGEVQAALDSLPSVGSSAVVVAGGRGDAGTTSPRVLTAFVEPAHRATPLPIPDGLPAVLAEAMDGAVQEVDLTALTSFRTAMGEAALSSIADALTAAFVGDATRTAEQVCSMLDVAPAQHRLVRRWLRGLVGAGRLSRDAAGAYHDLVVHGPQHTAQAWSQAAELEKSAGWSAELFAAVRHCAEDLPRLISGRTDPMSLMSAAAGPDALTAAYTGNTAARTLHEVLTAFVAEIAGNHRADGPLRIMEVGLRGGGAAARLVPALAGQDLEYLATDVSAHNRAAAAELHSEDARVRCAAFDPATDPRAQGFPPNSVDVLVCIGVLDNLPDVGAALANLRALVTPGGWLVLMQNIDDDDHALRVSTELLPEHAGPFSDVRAAEEQSFLRAAQWTELLGAQGDRVIAELPASATTAAVFGQRLFVVQPKPDREPVSVVELTRRAEELLPEYSVPSRWEVLDALPLTVNGKLDRTRLENWAEASDQQSAVAESAAPQDELERALAALWAELLERDQVGRDDDLFALGGDSLLVARIVGRLRDGVTTEDGRETLEWDLEWEVVLRHLLRRPTVAGLAAYLRGVAEEGAADGNREVSPIVVLEEGTEAVTVLVHAGTGILLPYRPLITEFRTQSSGRNGLLGLEIPELDDFLNADPNGLIDRLSARYAQALLDAGHTRFDIVGYCVGGVIATEVARALSEAGAEVRSLTVISSHSPTFRLDDELLSEYSFGLMMGIDLAAVGFPEDQARVGAAVGAVLEQSPEAVLDGAIADLEGEYADIAAAFTAMEALPRMRRVALMCEALPPELAGTYQPEGLLRALRTYQQSTFALSRHHAEPYAGDITFLRHNGSYPFPGSAETITDHWAKICLGELTSRDIPGQHFTCMTGDHVSTVFGHLSELIEGTTS